MATSEAAALLLRVAKKPELVASPPPAALRVVEQCDRLPLVRGMRSNSDAWHAMHAALLTPLFRTVRYTSCCTWPVR
jgi:hypothetical protein